VHPQEFFLFRLNNDDQLGHILFLLNALLSEKELTLGLKPMCNADYGDKTSSVTLVVEFCGLESTGSIFLQTDP
jgi:hypothetical protein